MKQYRILTGETRKELQEEVERYRKNKWKLHGSHCCTVIHFSTEKDKTILQWSQAVIEPSP